LREDELNKLLNRQKAHEQELLRREEQLRIRELDLIEREINMMIRQQTLIPMKPMPERRKGKFRKSRLKQLLKSGGMSISEPSSQYNTYHHCPGCCLVVILCCGVLGWPVFSSSHHTSLFEQPWISTQFSKLSDQIKNKWFFQIKCFFNGTIVRLQLYTDTDKVQDNE